LVKKEVLSEYRILLANVALLNAAMVDAGVFSPASTAADDASGDGGFADILALLTQDTPAETEIAGPSAQQNPATDDASGGGDAGASGPAAALVPAGIDAFMLMLTEPADRRVSPDDGNADAGATADDAATSGTDTASTMPETSANVAPALAEEPPAPPADASAENDEAAAGDRDADRSSAAAEKAGSGGPPAEDVSSQAKDAKDDDARNAFVAAENDILAASASPAPPQAEEMEIEDGDVKDASAATLPPVAAEKADPARPAADEAPPGRDENVDGAGDGDTDTETDDRAEGDAASDANAAAASLVSIAAVAVAAAVQPSAPASALASGTAEDGNAVLAVADAGVVPARPQAPAQAASAEVSDGGQTADTDDGGARSDFVQGFDDVLKNATASDAKDDAPAKSARTAPDAKTAPQSSASPATGDTGTAQTAAAPANAASVVAATAVPQAAGGASVKPAVRIAVSAAATDDDAATNLQSLGLTIAAKSAAGVKHFEIGLDPPDFGRIDVKLSVGDDGSVKAVLTADKPQTLALLQNDAASLVRSLNDAGLNLHQSALSFSLMGGGGSGQNGEHASYSGGGNLYAEAVVDTETTASTAPIFFSDGVRLDIRV
jgi:flagellar hook-length control protein FliK